MRRLIALFVTVGLWIAAGQTAPAVESTSAPKPELFREIEEIMKDLSEITGLKMRRRVASDTINKDGLRKFLEERLKEAVKPEEIRAEELTLKKLGLVPQEFDLRKTTVDLLTEQAAAFYDYKKKKLFVMDSNASMNDRAVLVHELAHALADEHFNLGKYIIKGKSDDMAVARQAVMEGQATWLMTEYMLFKVGTSLRKADTMADMMNQMNNSPGAGAFPVFDSAPLYLKESLIFPYTKGFSFQQAVIMKYGNQGFAEVFRNPPQSAQQIIHPEKYFKKVVPTQPELPKVKLKGYRGLVGGGVGEFDHNIMLQLHTTSEEAVFAQYWRGAQYRIMENRKANRAVLQYASEWETEDNALRFMQLYRRVLQHKWKKFEVTRESPSEVDGVGDDGRFQVRVIGKLVTSVEGLPQ
ncbi:MAG: hypothetical protein HY820_44390 [Acidobacteria bacterium]|nr:hypothetical protein [Acidobacteriota bacterium]